MPPALALGEGSPGHCRLPVGRRALRLPGRRATGARRVDGARRPSLVCPSAPPLQAPLLLEPSGSVMVAVSPSAGQRSSHDCTTDACPKRKFGLDVGRNPKKCKHSEDVLLSTTTTGDELLRDDTNPAKKIKQIECTTDGQSMEQKHSSRLNSPAASSTGTESGHATRR